MINAIEAKLPNLTVPLRAFRILVGGTVPIRSVLDFSNHLFMIIATTLYIPLTGAPGSWHLEQKKSRWLTRLLLPSWCAKLSGYD